MRLLFFSILCLVVLFTSSNVSAYELEEWKNMRGQIVFVFSSSVEKLLERGYLESKIIKFESKINSIEYTSNVEILNVELDSDLMSLLFNTTLSDVDQSMTLSIPRNILDSTYGYDDENDVWNTSEFYVVVDEEEILHKELKISNTDRMISFDIPSNSSQFEIIGGCIPEDCHISLDK